MKIICINDKIDKEMSTYFNYDSDGFDEYDMRDLKKQKADLIVYYYGAGSYEGNGYLIAKKDGRYDIYDCGHCSCYGPLDSFELSDVLPYKSLEDLQNNCSDDSKKDYLPLVDYLKSIGE